MKRIFPAPLISLALMVIWLLLNRSVSPANLIGAVLLGLILPWFTVGLRPRAVRVRKPLTLLRLLLRVVVDTTMSNLHVVALLMRVRHPSLHTVFVNVPLELRNPNGLAALATIVCITPGTAWAELSLDRTMLMIHVLDTREPETVIRDIKERYERPLMEIFE